MHVIHFGKSDTIIMLYVKEAQAKVLERAAPLEAQSLALGPAVLGWVLAEDVVSDLDMPPYDKSMMDGYAVRTVDLSAGRGDLFVIEEVTAGQIPRLPLEAGQVTRIMTGAPMPDGADAVIMVERTQMVDGRTVHIEDKPPRPGQNIMRRGREMRSGEVILSKGARLRPQELGLLATVGRTSARVQPAARVAVLSTGEEIVEAPALPGPGQIRNGNGPMLMAQVARAGGVPSYSGLARDSLDSLRPLVADGLRADILVLSGGVSAGKLDLVPGVLEELGVEAVFHKVAMKPGKPVFFGTHRHASGCMGLVFGLPGNPVSAFVCFELFVRPALCALMGLDPGPNMLRARLAEEFTYRTDRQTYHPAVLALDGGAWKVRPVPWLGSPDLRGMALANALVVIPVGDQVHRAGTELDVLAVDN
ncbi:MAG TPA: gephyrin-like molybdotransferase Glp [Gemmataceae bacterium]|nr:gephyrin-like molybdotransferase Glp [Gemmataceae bacterium]